MPVIFVLSVMPMWVSFESRMMLCIVRCVFCRACQFDFTSEGSTTFISHSHWLPEFSQFFIPTRPANYSDSSFNKILRATVHVLTSNNLESPRSPAIAHSSTSPYSTEFRRRSKPTHSQSRASTQAGHQPRPRQASILS